MDAPTPRSTRYRVVRYGPAAVFDCESELGALNLRSAPSKASRASDTHTDVDQLSTINTLVARLAARVEDLEETNSARFALLEHVSACPRVDAALA